jgi:hypothetical protein
MKELYNTYYRAIWTVIMSLGFGFFWITPSDYKVIPAFIFVLSLVELITFKHPKSTTKEEK